MADKKPEKSSPKGITVQKASEEEKASWSKPMRDFYDQAEKEALEESKKEMENTWEEVIVNVPGQQNEPSIWEYITTDGIKFVEDLKTDVQNTVKNLNRNTAARFKRLDKIELPSLTHYKLAGKHFIEHIQPGSWQVDLTEPKPDNPLPERHGTITEKDFSNQDLKVLKEVLSRPHLISPKPDKVPVDNDETRKWKEQGYKYIRLTDQPKKDTSVDDKDRELPSSLTSSISGLWYKHNEDGTINIKDRYDFDPKDLSFPNILGVALGAREKPGEISAGNPVDITLR